MKNQQKAKQPSGKIISHEKLISLELIQDNAERSERERRRQAQALLRELRAGARIEPGRITFNPRTMRVVAAS